MTSNAGSDRSGGSVGFGKTVSEQDEARAVKALEEIMRPEFLNRIDDIISFSHLTKEDFRGIATIMLGQLRDTLAENNIRLTWDDSLVDYLIEDPVRSSPSPPIYILRIVSGDFPSFSSFTTSAVFPSF